MAAKKIKLFSGPGTRRYPRYRISEVPVILGVSSEAGFTIKVVNISRGGALVRTRGRLIPGTRIRLNIETSNDCIALTGFVLRNDTTYPKWMPGHQAAVAFDRPLSILGGYPETTADLSQAFINESSPSHAASEPDPSITPSAENKDSTVIAAFLKAGIRREQDEDLPEVFRMNNW